MTKHSSLKFAFPVWLFWYHRKKKNASIFI